MGKKKIKTRSTYYIVIFIFLVCVSVVIYNRYIIKQVKGYYDYKTSLIVDTIPKDTLINDYDKYIKFLKNNLKSKEYIKIINENIITKESFIKNDYIVLFYETRMCSNDSHAKGLSELDDKVVLTVNRYEDDECELETRISFIPVEKDKYETMPNVIIKKEIVKK